MPDLRQCRYSPFLFDRTIYGAAMITGHRRYCDKINPKHPDYDPRFVADYPAMSYTLMGLELPERYVRRKRPRRPDDGPRVAQGPGEPPTALPATFAPIADEATHLRVYGAARDCPHRIASTSCCDPDRCGPGGVHEGSRVDMGICYPCSAGRIGIAPGRA